jgi:hypothetical protein
MAVENDLTTFSIRIPRSLCDQIEARKKVSKRSRNGEITLLLETAIDILVARDKRLQTSEPPKE